VTPHATREWIDWLLVWIQVVGPILTIAAVTFAGLQIWVAKRQAQQADAAMIRERRMEFELGVLKDLLAAVGQVDLLAITALGYMLPVDEIPLTRAAVGISSNDSANARVAALRLEEHHRTRYIEELKDPIGREVLDAIKKRARDRQVQSQ